MWGEVTTAIHGCAIEACVSHSTLLALTLSPCAWVLSPQPRLRFRPPLPVVVVNDIGWLELWTGIIVPVLTLALAVWALTLAIQAHKREQAAEVRLNNAAKVEERRELGQRLIDYSQARVDGRILTAADIDNLTTPLQSTLPGATTLSEWVAREYDALSKHFPVHKTNPDYTSARYTLHFDVSRRVKFWVTTGLVLGGPHAGSEKWPPLSTT